MNVGMGAEAAQFLFLEYKNWIFGTLYNKYSTDKEICLHNPGGSFADNKPLS
jgi:hypothetical protein